MIEENYWQYLPRYGGGIPERSDSPHAGCQCRLHRPESRTERIKNAEISKEPAAFHFCEGSGFFMIMEDFYKRIYDSGGVNSSELKPRIIRKTAGTRVSPKAKGMPWPNRLEIKRF